MPFTKRFCNKDRDLPEARRDGSLRSDQALNFACLFPVWVQDSLMHINLRDFLSWSIPIFQPIYGCKMKDHITYEKSGEIGGPVLCKPRSSTALRTPLAIKKAHFCDQIQFRRFLLPDWPISIANSSVLQAISQVTGYYILSNGSIHQTWSTQIDIIFSQQWLSVQKALSLMVFSPQKIGDPFKKVSLTVIPGCPNALVLRSRYGILLMNTDITSTHTPMAKVYI